MALSIPTLAYGRTRSMNSTGKASGFRNRLSPVLLLIPLVMAAVWPDASRASATALVLSGCAALAISRRRHPDEGARSAAFGLEGGLCHVLALLALLLHVTGRCHAGCAILSRWTSFAGMPTVMAGIAIHGLLALVTLIGSYAGTQGRSPGAGRLLGESIAIGASVYFAAVMVREGMWCGPCALAHGAMFLQAVAMWRWAGRHRRLAFILAVGGCAGIFHLWYSLMPYGGVPDPGEPGMAATLGRAALLQRPSAKPSPPERQRRDHEMGAWGRASAPVVITVCMDPACPSCRASLPAVLGLGEDVRRGRIRIDLDLVYRLVPDPDLRGRAACYLAYAAGCLGEHELMETLPRLMEGIGTLQGPHDQQGVVRALAALLPRDLPSRLAAVLRARAQAIGDRISAGFAFQYRQGRDITPLFVFRRRGDATSYTSLAGMRTTSELRFAARIGRPTGDQGAKP